MSKSSNKLNPQLLPLIELLARAAYESLRDAPVERPRTLPENQPRSPELPNERPAA